MRITQLGHASLYIETADVRVLMDPVLIDPHQEGLLEVFPRREVRWERLPPFEILFISHQHLDHFDIATLARLPRDAQVIIPEDPLMISAFEALGFKSVVCIRDYYTFQVGRSRFLVTPSEATHPEHGLLISDPDGTFWNQVDTILNAGQLDRVLAQFPTIDLMLATWQPMMELEWQYNRPLNFPWNSYGKLLEITRQIRPRALAPGSNGYRYAGSSSWLNQVVFPQTRERYLADMETMIPALKGRTFEFDPGDVLELRAGEPTLHRRASNFITSAARDPYELEFKPATAQRPLRDISGENEAELRAAVAEFVERLFPEHLRSHPLLFRNHKDWRVIYQLEVAYAQRAEHWWCDFSASEVRFQAGRNPLANLSCGITASGLAGLLKGTCGWDRVALAGQFYQLHCVYGLWENGLVLPAVAISNPLHLIFFDEDVTERLIQSQIAAHRRAAAPRGALPQPALRSTQKERRTHNAKA